MTKKSQNDHNAADKFRDELFEVRVDVKAYIRSLKILAGAVAVLFGILAYFGYDKIDSVQQTVLNKANQRLAKTDSLLANVDQSKLDSLNRILIQKQREYELTLLNFESALKKNRELESKLFETLKPNERIEYELTRYSVHSPEDYFEIRPFPDKFRPNQRLDIYLTFLENYDFSRARLLLVDITQLRENQRYGVKEYKFKVQQRLNKMSMTLDLPKGIYHLEVGFVTKDGDSHSFYRLQKNIEII